MAIGRCLLSLAFLLLSISPSHATEFIGRVIVVRDGDTIEVVSNITIERIRFRGIEQEGILM